MMIGRTSIAVSVGTSIMAERRGVVMILTLLCAFVSTDGFGDPTLGSTLGVALSTLLFGFLVIRRSADAPCDLWNISGSTHKHLVEREARRRILFKVSRDHARDGKRRMSEGTYELREFDRNQRIFDRRADPRQLSGIAQNLSLPEAALGSMGGFTASQNARVASLFALITSCAQPVVATPGLNLGRAPVRWSADRAGVHLPLSWPDGAPARDPGQAGFWVSRSPLETALSAILRTYSIAATSSTLQGEKQW